MNIAIVTPAPPGSRKGNRVTAMRWARLLRQLGHRVRVCHGHHGGRWDLLVALHARRSAGVVEVFRRRARIKKVGHTGTLDPLATGLLVLCVGKATRLQSYLLRTPDYRTRGQTNPRRRR